MDATKQRWHNDRLVSDAEPVDSEAFFAGVREQPKAWPRVPRWPMLRPALLLYAVAAVAIAAHFWRGAVPAISPQIEPSRPVLLRTVNVTGPTQIDTGEQTATVECSEVCYVSTGEANPATGVPVYRETLAAVAGRTIHVWAERGVVRVWRRKR